MLFITFYYDNKIKNCMIGRTCKAHGNCTNAYEIVGGKSEGTREFREVIYRCKNNVRMDLK